MKNFKSIFFIIILLPLTIMSCGDNSKVSQEMKNLETSVNECISEINELNGDIKVCEKVGDEVKQFIAIKKRNNQLNDKCVEIAIDLQASTAVYGAEILMLKITKIPGKGKMQLEKVYERLNQLKETCD